MSAFDPKPTLQNCKQLFQNWLPGWDRRRIIAIVCRWAERRTERSEMTAEFVNEAA
jgi:hypothetical protein